MTNKVIITLLLTVLIFTAVVILCNIDGIQIQSELIISFLSLIAAELGIMGAIRVKKNGFHTGERDEGEGENDEGGEGNG